MKKLKLWISRKVFEACAPRMHEVIRAQVEHELNSQHRLTADIRNMILYELERRVPVEGTTHALACHLRDQLARVDARVGKLEREQQITPERAIPIDRPRGYRG